MHVRLVFVLHRQIAAVLGTFLFVAATVGGSGAQAADSFSEATASKYPAGWYLPRIDEVRIGGMAHGIGNPERDTAAVDMRVLTSVIWRPSDPDFWWLAPRLHAGGHVSTGGKTSYGYFGLTWTWDDVLFDRTFGEFSFGPSFNDGYTGRFAPLDRAKLGCETLFHESGSIGYRITDNWTVMLTADHISNGGLCKQNRGISNVGASIGYRF